MFTSLAEHRLILRIDNAADRLMHYGAQYGLVGQEEYEKHSKERQDIDAVLTRLSKTFVRPDAANPVLREKGEAEIPEERGKQNLLQILKRPGVSYRDVMRIGGFGIKRHIGARVEIEAKYEGYIRREEEMIERLQELENVRIPSSFDFKTITGISNEAKSKLSEVKPINLDQASRIQGISPSDILLLLLHIKKGR